MHGLMRGKRAKPSNLLYRKLLEQWWVLNKYFEEIFAKSMSAYEL